MISKLIGIIDEIEEDSITLNVNGVGYLVYIPNGSFLGESTSETRSLYIQTLVKEDAINLYGFKDLAQKQLFNLLISVQGVGAKIALLMISKLSPADLQQAIMFEDINVLKSINGIGAKVAQRLITELKDKMSKISLAGSNGIEVNSSVPNKDKLNNTNALDAILALEGLGYSKFEITKVISKIQQEISTELTTEELIKEYLVRAAQGLGN